MSKVEFGAIKDHDGLNGSDGFSSMPGTSAISLALYGVLVIPASSTQNHIDDLGRSGVVVVAK